MADRLRAAIAIALVAALLAAGEVVWVLAYLDRSSDGPAFVMALVVTVVLPTLLAAMGASLVHVAPRWARVAVTGAVTASGLTAAGVQARFFVADQPADPAFIHWVAAMPLFALVVAMLLVGPAARALLRPAPRVRRIVLMALAAVVLPVVLTVVVLIGTSFVVLLALVSPIVLVTVAAVESRRQRLRATV